MDYMLQLALCCTSSATLSNVCPPISQTYLLAAFYLFVHCVLRSSIVEYVRQVFISKCFWIPYPWVLVDSEAHSQYQQVSTGKYLGSLDLQHSTQLFLIGTEDSKANGRHRKGSESSQSHFTNASSC